MLSREISNAIGPLGKWCPEADLNHRHADFQSSVIPPISVACDEKTVKPEIEDQALSRDLSKAKASAALIEEAVFGLGISRKIGQPELAVGTSVLMMLDAQSRRCTATTAQIAHALRMNEQHVIGALRSMQGKGLLRIVIEPDVEAMARLGDDYRAIKSRLHEREA